MKEGTTGGIKKAKMKKESEKKEDKNMIDDAILLMDNYGPDSPQHNGEELSPEVVHRDGL